MQLAAFVVVAFGISTLAEAPPITRVHASSAKGQSHSLKIDEVAIISATAKDAAIQFALTITDEANDVDLKNVAGRAFVVCGNAGFGLSLGAPDKVAKKGPTTNTVWISNGMPGTQVSGSCEISVYVEDKAGNKSATVKAKAEFK